MNDKQAFARGNGVGQLHIAFLHALQHGRPVRLGVRPRQLYATLRKPFRQQSLACAVQGRFHTFAFEEQFQVKRVLRSLGREGEEAHV